MENKNDINKKKASNINKRIEEAQNKFLQRIENLQGNSGFVFYSKPTLNTEAQGEFRIAIKPEPENLRKAAKVIAPVLFKHDVQEAKCFMLYEDALENIPWDAALYKFEQSGSGSDRDQRGKEVCVYLHPEEKTTEQWKALLLDLWEALQEAKVDIGYVSPRRGEREIPVEAGMVSPFFYTVSKPWRIGAPYDTKNEYGVRHGILLATSYNVFNKGDELAEVSLTRNDLKSRKIDYHNIQSQRISYQKNHYTEVEKLIKSDIQVLYKKSQTIAQIEFDVIKHLDEIKQAINKYNPDNLSNLQAYLNLTENQKIRDLIAARCPKMPDSDLHDSPGMRSFLINWDMVIKDTKYINDFLLSIDMLKNEYHFELQETYKEITENPYVMSLLGQALNMANKVNLESTIKNILSVMPAELQIMYRRALHLQHEAEAIEWEDDRYLIEQIYQMWKQDSNFMEPKSSTTKAIDLCFEQEINDENLKKGLIPEKDCLYKFLTNLYEKTSKALKVKRSQYFIPSLRLPATEKLHRIVANNLFILGHDRLVDKNIIENSMPEVESPFTIVRKTLSQLHEYIDSLPKKASGEQEILTILKNHNELLQPKQDDGDSLGKALNLLHKVLEIARGKLKYVKKGDHLFNFFNTIAHAEPRKFFSTASRKENTWELYEKLAAVDLADIDGTSSLKSLMEFLQKRNNSTLIKESKSDTPKKTF